MTPLALETIRAALERIPADLPRADWARVGMALKSELGVGGFELFDAYSRRGAKYDKRSTRDTWRSIKAGGAVKIGSLIHLAKEHGFRLEEAAPSAPVSTAEIKAVAQAREVRDQREAARRETAQREAAAEARRLWDEASTEGVSGYLTRKGVQGHGVRHAADGRLLVPLRDVLGELWNLQRIAASKPAAGPDKLFLKGGRKSGLWHWCGEPDNAPALLVAEGYATAATIHEATGRPVAVAFDAGNLVHVAQALRLAYPKVLIVICGDDDRATEAATERNPGREKAKAAGAKVRGAVVLPEQLPDGGSDFNDLSAAVGPDAVRVQIEAAIAAALQLNKGDSKARQAPNADASVLLDRFTVNSDGVWFTEHDNEGRTKSPMWVCTPVTVPALTRDADGQGWGYLLEFTDPAGNARQWAMPARMLAGDGAEFRGVLLAFGLRIAASTRARALLAQYIQTRQPAEHARCTDRIGWHGRAFVLPRETLGDAGERVVFQTDGTVENTFRQRGTLPQWREKVARLCIGNSRLAFAVACAFAGPTLRPAAIDSGGFHLRGDSSNGKTTVLRVAASVYGGANYLQRWKSTENALEGTAAQHCDGLLILDELAQVDPKSAGECAYLLANETAKARSTRTGQNRPRLTWRLLFLSSGEIGLAAHMADGGKRARAGQELRMADIPADAGAGRGVFEELHDHEHGAALAHQLNKAADAFHGTAGRAFLEWAVSNVDTLRDRTRAGVEQLATKWIPELASGQVQRVGRRFAVVAVAGELATEAGITGWPVGEATAAARTCFHAWLESRGGIGNAEDAQMLRQVRRFFEAHGEGRFTHWDRAERDDDHAPKTLYRAGFRKPIKDTMGDVTGWDFYVFKETFRGEICEGFDYKAVLRVLRDHQCLEPDKSRPFDCRPRLPGLGLTACYCIKSAIFDSET